MSIQEEILNLSIEINLIKPGMQKIQNYLANFFLQLQPKISEIVIDLLPLLNTMRLLYKVENFKKILNILKNEMRMIVDPLE
ncbi:MAG TPA: hypothetical protein VJ697_12565 [Nitrososphaeraceae archaeon]|nr:hypothetical protein [Nitrososphaeraceae archaeon]